MNKKSLLKKMSIVVASAAMMVTALPLTASAASYNNNTYKASVNFYVPQDQAPKNLFTAYLNDTSIPPKNAATNNVDVAINNGVMTFDLPINNAQFGIKTLGAPTASGITATLQGAKDVDCSKHSGTRYTNLHVVLNTKNDGAQELNYEFAASTLHAKITKTLVGNITITPYDGNFSANPELKVVLPDSAISK